MAIGVSTSSRRAARLVGRELEQRALERILREAREGHSGVLVLRGEPGIGKSALCCDAIDRARGMRTLAVQPVQSESELPFAGLSELLGPVLELRGRLPEPQASALAGALALREATAGGRFPVCVATLGLIAAAAVEQPLLVVVDDAQWLDRPSAEAVAFTARRLSADRVAMLLAVREGETDGHELRGFNELTLRGLSRDALRELLREWHGDEIAAPVAGRLIDAAAGNPLALSELGRGLSVAQRRGSEPLADPLPIGGELQAAFLRRCTQLPPGTRTGLLVTAASNGAGREIVDRALSSYGLDPDVLRPAEDAGILTLTGTRVEFRHPLLRSAVYHAASLTTRRRVHAALADVLLEDPDRRAWQLAAAASGPDDPAAAALQQAGQVARRRGAHATSMRMLRRSAELSADPPERARRLLFAASSAHAAGMTELAIELLAQARAPDQDPKLRARIQHLRGTLELLSGSPRKACDLLTAEAALVEQLDPRRCALMLAEAAVIAGMGHDMNAGLAIAQHAVQAAAGDDQLGWILDAFHKTLRVIHGDLPGPGPLSQLSTTLIDIDQRIPMASWIVPLAAIDLVYAERYTQATGLLDRAVDRARANGAISELVPALTTRADLGSRTGHWQSAYADAHEAIALAEESAQHNVQAWALGVLAWLDAAAGRSEECRAHSAEGTRIASELQFGGGRIKAQAPIGLLELGHGEFDAAVQTLEQTHQLSEDQGIRNPSIVWWAGDLVEACARAGQTDRARRRLAELDSASERTASQWGKGVARRARLLLAREGSTEALTETVLGQLAALPAPFEEARTRLAWGQQLRRRGERTEGRHQFERALDRFELLGATPWSAQARQELNVGAASPRRRGDRDADDQLTPQELRVALMVADGATNRETAAKLFLSPRTIGAHLERIYRKLGINRRGQLAHALEHQSRTPSS